MFRIRWTQIQTPPSSLPCPSLPIDADAFSKFRPSCDGLGHESPHPSSMSGLVEILTNNPVARFGSTHHHHLHRWCPPS